MAGRSNAQWLADLGTPGPRRDAALQDLRATLLAGLPYALSGWMAPDDPRLETFIEEIAQETLLRVLDNLHTFEGRSKFTTWAHKIAVHAALSEMRRKRWQDTSLEALLEATEREDSQLIASRHPGPELTIEQADLIERVRRIIEEELTEKQRTVLVAARVHSMPASEVARRMGTNPNALYKLMHDARLRLKERLAREGLSPQDILAAFEPR